MGSTGSFSKLTFRINKHFKKGVSPCSYCILMRYNFDPIWSDLVCWRFHCVPLMWCYTSRFLTQHYYYCNMVQKATFTRILKAIKICIIVARILGRKSSGVTSPQAQQKVKMVIYRIFFLDRIKYNKHTYIYGNIYLHNLSSTLDSSLPTVVLLSLLLSLKCSS